MTKKDGSSIPGVGSSVGAPEKTYWLAGGKKTIPHMTQAAARFSMEHSRLLDLHLFIQESKVTRVKNGIDGDEAALVEIVSKLAHAEVLLREVIISRVVENFLTFISELLALIYKTRPEMLKSSEHERVDFLLQFETMDELRAALAEKRVEKLAYLGLKELGAHLEAHMNFQLFPDADERERAALIVEYRNLYVHNRGVVNSGSVRRFPVLASQLNRRVIIPSDKVRELRQFLENAVIDVDLRAIEKFGLPCTAVADPPDSLIG